MARNGLFKKTVEHRTQNPKVFGSIPGVEVFQKFKSREELSLAGVHAGNMAGIYGLAENGGAYSIVVSGGYEDDVDNGEVLIYTGHGGRQSGRNGAQTHDQVWDGGNAALKMSCKKGNPVRVTRGFRLPSKYAPPTGYRYDGLYRVTEAWQEEGHSGFKMCRFRLERLEGQPDVPQNSFYKETSKQRTLKLADGSSNSSAVGVAPSRVIFAKWEGGDSAQVQPLSNPSAGHAAAAPPPRRFFDDEPAMPDFLSEHLQRAQRKGWNR